jgi:hypothetical protein
MRGGFMGDVVSIDDRYATEKELDEMMKALQQVAEMLENY